MLLESTESRKIFTDKDWHPITLTRKSYTGLVYSLDVAGDHTYFADGLLTHNCRYQRSCHRRRQAFVLSGTGSIFRVSVMREVCSERENKLPGINGEFYNRQSITEDDEITLAIKTLGYKCLAPVGAQTTTEVMPTWGDLIRQRLRWQSGALIDLRNYGFSRITAPYIARQVALYLGFACMWICLGIMLGSLMHHVGFSMIWGAGVLVVNAIERVWTATKAGWRGMLLALLVLPEVDYAIFLSVVFFQALKKVITRQDMEWNHLERENILANQ